MDGEKLIILLQGHECLYNLQHNDYNNNLVKDNCWKEIAGEWQGSSRVAAGERHGICESAFKGSYSALSEGVIKCCIFHCQLPYILGF
jgi:hypothetical protein